MAYRLKPGEDARDATRRIVAGEAKIALVELRTAADPAHAARRRLKRIRAMLRLARSGMKGADFARANADWREAGWILAPLRDQNARLEAIACLREQVEEPAAMAALSSLREHLTAHAPLDAAVTLERAARMIADAAERAGRLRVQGKAASVFAEGVRHAYRRGGERGAAAYESGAAADFHDWRKSVKTLGLQLRVVEPVSPDEEDAPGAPGALRPRFDELGDLLGEDHDLAQLGALIARHPELLGAADQREALEALLAERSLMLRARARPVYEALYADKPKTFARRIETRLKDLAAAH